MKMLNRATFLLATATLAFAAGPGDNLYTAVRTNDLASLHNLVKDSATANAKDDHGVTPLMYAAAAGSIDSMKYLLEKGADAKSVNMFGSTALMWSVTDIAKVRLLIDHGADVKAVSKQGRTALQLAALSDHSAEIVRLLLAKGADPKTVDSMGMTTLNAATLGNDMETIRILVDAGVDVNTSGALMAADAIVGETPLANAVANGNVAATRLLLSRKADVNLAGSRDKLFQVKNGSILLGGFSPLAMAAAYGPAEIVKMLLDAGADVNTKDVRGMTPLMLAVATDRQNLEIIRMLLAKGADINASSKVGETAFDWAQKVGGAEVISMLEKAGAKKGDASMEAPVHRASAVALKPAVERSMKLLETSAGTFFSNGGCVSCHSQNVTDIAAAAAGSKGVAVNAKASAERLKQLEAIFGPFAPMLLERIDPPGAQDTTAYALNGLASAGVAPSAMTDAMAANLAAMQSATGNWHVGGWARPPIEDSDISRTALCIRSLKVYGAPGRAAEMADRLGRAKNWLMSAKAATAEERSMQLMGLAWSGADAATLRKFADSILKAQRADGGWSQRAEIASDAYATGESLYALVEAKCIQPKDAAYQKGVNFLLDTQAADGSWYVKSRAPKFQPYFESGFPYGHDQWISATATAWATIALALAL
jgi:ankyrin repeat protein